MATKTITPKRVAAEAAKIMAKLSDEAIAYAANVKRGEFRGFAALHDLCDANMLLPNANHWTWSDAQVELANAVAAEVTRLLLAHPLANQREELFQPGERVRYTNPHTGTEARARFEVVRCNRRTTRLRYRDLVSGEKTFDEKTVLLRRDIPVGRRTARQKGVAA